VRDEDININEFDEVDDYFDDDKYEDDTNNNE
jgi:hypothetical protein